MEFDYETLTAGSLLLLFGLLYLASFIDAIAGGGGLISLPAYLLTGMPVHYAMGCNKTSASCGTLIATVQYLRGGVLDWRVAIISAVFSFLGSAGGTGVALLIDDAALKKAVVIIIPVVAVIILLKRNFGDESHADSLSAGKRHIFGALIGLFIGFYDGLIGPGTGTFAIIAYCLLMKYDMTTASGNAKMLNLASNVASAVTFGLAGTVAYKVALPAAVFCFLGGLTGSKLAVKKGARFIRPMLVVVLALIMVKLAVDVFA